MTRHILVDLRCLLKDVELAENWKVELRLYKEWYGSSIVLEVEKGKVIGYTSLSDSAQVLDFLVGNSFSNAKKYIRILRRSGRAFVAKIRATQRYKELSDAETRIRAKMFDKSEAFRKVVS